MLRMPCKYVHMRTEPKIYHICFLIFSLLSLRFGITRTSWLNMKRQILNLCGFALFSPGKQGQAQTQEDIQTPRNKHKDKMFRFVWLRFRFSVFVWSLFGVRDFRTFKNEQLILDTINTRSDIKLLIVQSYLADEYRSQHEYMYANIKKICTCISY